MDPETETKLHAAIRLFIDSLFWHIRREGGEFPIMLRVNVRFDRGENKSYTFESQVEYPLEKHAEAEKEWQEYLEKRAMEEARTILIDGVDEDPEE